MSRRLSRPAIIVSPLLPTHLKLPPPAQLIPLAIRAEELATCRSANAAGLSPARPKTGCLACTSPSLASPGQAGPRNVGCTPCNADRNFYYGINYVAAAEQFARHEATFWQVARSIRRRLQPQTPAEPGLEPGGPAKPGEARDRQANG